jgi:hypothetical protein
MVPPALKVKIYFETFMRGKTPPYVKIMIGCAPEIAYSSYLSYLLN